MRLKKSCGAQERRNITHMACACVPSEDPFTTSIQGKLSSGELRMSDVLREKSAFFAIKRQNLELSHFVASHVSQLLESALYDHDPIIRSNAIKIIETKNPIIIEALCGCEDLRTLIAGLLDDKPEDSFLGPVCQVIESCVVQLPVQLDISLSFIIDLLALCSHLPVYYLFENLIGSCGQTDLVADHLASRGFVGRLVSAIVDGYVGSAERHIENLYELLIRCCSIGPYQPDCFAPGTVRLALDYLDETDPTLQVAQWRLRGALLNTETIGHFASLIVPAIEIATDGSIAEIGPLQVEVVDFLSHIYEMDRGLVRDSNTGELVSCLAGWFDEWPDHEICLRAICRFMQVAIEIPELAGDVIQYFLPAVVGAELKELNRVQIAFAVDWAGRVRDLMEEDPAIEAGLADQAEFLEFCRTTVARHQQMIRQDYGGATFRLPPVAAIASPPLAFKRRTIDA
jgi:hypothetical protein